jgi:CBS domain-containing protein
MKRRSLVKAPPNLSVAKAAKLMTRKNVGAIMVVDGDRLIGVFTERDVVFRAVAAGLDLEATRVGDVMTRSPHTIGPDEPFGCALLIMHEKRFRHLPVLEGDRIVGIVSARSAMDPELEEFVSEAQRRRFFQRERASTPHIRRRAPR